MTELEIIGRSETLLGQTLGHNVTDVFIVYRLLGRQ